MSDPTLGALRAARAIDRDYKDRGCGLPWPEVLAEIIDRETAAPELLEALAEHVELTDDGQEHDPACVCLTCRSCEAIAKATREER